MIVVGITGSVGMGKSMVASQFARLGAKMCSSDTIVHMLLAGDAQVIGAVKKLFPEAVKQNGIDRVALGKIVFADEKKRTQLERILHPRVAQVETRFARRQRRMGAKMVVLDIPLLFETHSQSRMDFTVVASAPHFLQKQRVLRRPGMSEERFAKLLAIQMPDREKRARADIVVATGLGRAHSFRQVKHIMMELGLA